MKKQASNLSQLSFQLSSVFLFLIGTAAFMLLTSMDGCGPDDDSLIIVDDTTVDDVPIWRLQIRTHTCNRNKAGTDSKVFVRLDENQNNIYWLDLGGDDRDRNETNIYDVLILDENDRPSIRTLGDIQELTFGIDGGNRWCFDRVEILVNNPFDRSASRDQTDPFVIFDSVELFEISTDQGYQSEVRVANFNELRGALWNDDGIRENIHGVPIIPGINRLGFQREVMEEMLEGLLGNLMGPDKAASSLKWGKKEGRAYVGIRHKDNHPNNVARIDIDVHPSRIFDAEVIIRVFCDEEDDNMNVEIIGTDLDGSRFIHIMSLGVTAVIESALEGAANQSLNTPISISETCINPNFTSDHHLVLH